MTAVMITTSTVMILMMMTMTTMTMMMRTMTAVMSGIGDGSDNASWYISTKSHDREREVNRAKIVYEFIKQLALHGILRITFNSHQRMLTLTTQHWSVL